MDQKCSIHSIHPDWKIPWLLILIFFFHSHSNAQLPANIDSLRAELMKEIPDTTRINNLNALSNSLIKSKDFPGVLSTAKEALLLAEKVNFPKGIAYANLYLGVVEMENKNYTSALDKFDISYEIFKDTQDSLGLARYYHRSGNVFFRQKLRREFIQRYQSAIALYERLERTYPAESNFYRLNEIMMICDAAFFIPDYNLAKYYCQQGNELAETLDNQKEQARALRTLGSIDFEQHNYSACVPHFKKSLALSEQAGTMNDFDKHQNAVVNFYLGVSYSRYLGDIAQGLQYYKVAQRMQEELGNNKLVCETLTYMGNDLAEHGYYAEALEHYLDALTLSEKANDKLNTFLVHKSIGDLSRRNTNFDEAEKHYAQAQLLNKQLGLKLEAASILHNLGLIQTTKGNKEAAIQIFYDMKELGAEMKDTHTMVIAYTNLLLLNEPIENQSELLPLFLSDLEKEEKKGTSTLTMDMYRFVGIFFFKSLDYVQAEEYFMKSLELAKKLKNNRGIFSAYQNLKVVKSVRGEFEKALEYGDLSVTYFDSLSNENNRRVLAEIQTKYDTERKEKEILNLQSEKQISDLELKVHQEALQRIALEKEKIQSENRFNLSQVDLLANEKRLQQLDLEKNKIELAMQKAESESSQGQLVILNKEGEIQKLELKKQTLLKNALLAGVGTLLLFGFFVYRHYITRQQLKLQTLRNKIAADLHDDVGSTLSSISIFSEMARQQSKEVIPMLDTIDESSRKMLDAMADIVWTIHPENDQFEKIILRMRSFAYNLLGAKEIHFTFEADQNIAQLRLPMDVRKNLYLIFKEAANNLAKYSGANQAHFSIKRETKMLELVIQDNGKGFDTSLLMEGNGLRNMKRRAQEIGGHLSIASQPGNGTTIQLQIAI